MTKNTKRRIMLYASSAARKNSIIQYFFVGAVKASDKYKHNGQQGKKLDEAIVSYTNIPVRERKKLKEVLWYDVATYLIDPEEYFLYGFNKMSAKDKQQYVGNREKELLCGLLNHQKANKGVWKLFMDKWKTYERFKQFYNREAIHITCAEDKDKFIGFCQKHKEVIFKNPDSSQGRGIYRISSSSDLDAEFLNIKETVLDHNKDAIAEELVVQSKAMSAFNDSSVNTVRIATFRDGNSPIIMFAILKAGRQGSVVDNGGAGGVLVSVDLNTGRCESCGYDEAGHRYEYHPDSKVRFLGYQLPEWDQALALVKALTDVVPEQIYVGWDIAHTDNGWVMIEGNSWGQFCGSQITLKTGIKSLIEQTFYKYLKIRG